VELNIDMEAAGIKSLLLVIILTLLSGYGDSRGFIHASGMWRDGNFIFDEFIKSALGFGLGIATYWLVVKYLQEFGIVSTEIQTVIWFATAIIGVAISSGYFFKWHFIDQVVGVIAVFSIAWLLYRTSG
jgi:hypothetical protein